MHKRKICSCFWPIENIFEKPQIESYFLSIFQHKTQSSSSTKKQSARQISVSVCQLHEKNQKIMPVIMVKKIKPLYKLLGSLSSWQFNFFRIFTEMAISQNMGCADEHCATTNNRSILIPTGILIIWMDLQNKKNRKSIRWKFGSQAIGWVSLPSSF